MRSLRAAVALFSLLASGVLYHPPSPAAAAGVSPDSSRALQTYLRGVTTVVRHFEVANAGVISAVAELVKNNRGGAVRQLTKAASGEAKAKRELDGLIVPRKALGVQRLLDGALVKFIAGTDLMRQGASENSQSRFMSGLSLYYQGDGLLAQVYPLVSRLGR